MRLAEEIFLGWVVGFLLPKSIVIPIFRGMWRSMKETERLDAEQARLDGRGDGGPPVRRFRARRPRGPRRPRPMPPLRARLRPPRSRT